VAPPRLPAPIGLIVSAPALSSGALLRTFCGPVGLARGAVPQQPGRSDRRATQAPSGHLRRTAQLGPARLHRGSHSRPASPELLAVDHNCDGATGHERDDLFQSLPMSSGDGTQFPEGEPAASAPTRPWTGTPVSRRPSAPRHALPHGGIGRLLSRWWGGAMMSTPRRQLQLTVTGGRAAPL